MGKSQIKSHMSVHLHKTTCPHPDFMKFFVHVTCDYDLVGPPVMTVQPRT